MQDLFTCDLTDVTADDVRAFLQMDAALGDRLGEGTRIDYKQELPQDIGDVICAFANTIGGLLFVGVSEQGGRPKDLVGIPKTRADLKTRLANIIQSTVHPRPQFSIEVVGLAGDSAREIAIIRVAAGEWPPYMFTKDRRNKLSVRVEDSCEPASYSDLEALFRQRQEASPEGLSAAHLPGPYLALPDAAPVNSSETSMVRLWVQPVRSRRSILDRRHESDVCTALKEDFSTSDIKVERRDASTFDVIVATHFRRFRWRSCDSGTQGIAANVAATTADRGSVVFIPLLVDRWIRTFRAVSRILEGRGWLAGPVLVHSELVIAGTGVSEAKLLMDIEPLSGLDALESLSVQRKVFTIDLVADQSDLAAPGSLVAELLFQHLREQLGLDADFDAVSRSVQSAAEKVMNLQRRT